ncbi:MAG: PadR family transcriptional regulator [Candidatus Hadarchaeota archaeon]
MKRAHDAWRVHMHKEMKRGLLSMWILWALKKKGGEMYGYEIIQQLEMKTKGKWVPKAGTVYPILRRLEKLGFVKSTWTTKKTGGPSRRYYKITGEGEKAAEAAFSEWRKVMTGFRDFLREIFGVD